MRGLIAIVDDDQFFREAVASSMNSLGYRALAYSSADEFMQSAERSRTGCLITDVNMPGMTGPQLHDRLIELGERIPTIFVSAYPSQAVGKRALEMEECYLTKPFREDELLACVRSAFERGAPPD